MLPKKAAVLLPIFFLFIATIFSFKRNAPGDREKIATEMETVIKQMLSSWYPKSIDTAHGGFLTTFTYDFNPTSPQDKMIVT